MRQVRVIVGLQRLLLLLFVIESVVGYRVGVLSSWCSAEELVVLSSWERAFPEVSLFPTCVPEQDANAILQSRYDFVLVRDSLEFLEHSAAPSYPCTFVYYHYATNSCNSIFLHDSQDAFRITDVVSHLGKSYVLIVGPESSRIVGERFSERIYHSSANLVLPFFGPVADLPQYLSGLSSEQCSSLILYNMYRMVSDLEPFFQIVQSHPCLTSASIVSLRMEPFFVSSHASLVSGTYWLSHFFDDQTIPEIQRLKLDLGLLPTTVLSDFIYLLYVLSTELMSLPATPDFLSRSSLHGRLSKMEYTDSLGSMNFSNSYSLNRPSLLGRLPPDGRVILEASFPFNPSFFLPEPYCSRGSSTLHLPLMVGFLDLTSASVRRSQSYRGIKRAERDILPEKSERIFAMSLVYPSLRSIVSGNITLQFETLLSSKIDLMFMLGSFDGFDRILQDMLTADLTVFYFGISPGQYCYKNVVTFFIPIPAQLEAINGGNLPGGILFYSPTDYGFRARSYFFSSYQSYSNAIRVEEYVRSDPNQLLSLSATEWIYTAMGDSYLLSFIRAYSALQLTNPVLFLDFTDSLHDILMPSDWSRNFHAIVPTAYVSPSCCLYESEFDFFVGLATSLVHSLSRSAQYASSVKFYEFIPGESHEIRGERFVVNSNNFVSMSLHLVRFNDILSDRLLPEGTPSGFSTIMPWYPSYFDHRSVLRCIFGTNDPMSIPVFTILIVDTSISLEYVRDILELTGYYDQLQIYLNVFQITLSDLSNYLNEVKVFFVVGGNTPEERALLSESLLPYDIPIFSLRDWIGEECLPNVFHMGILRNSGLSESTFVFLNMGERSLTYIATNSSDPLDEYYIPYLKEISDLLTIPFFFFFLTEIPIVDMMPRIKQAMPSGGIVFCRLSDPFLKEYLNLFALQDRQKWRHIIYFDYSVDSTFETADVFFPFSSEFEDILNKRTLSSPFVPSTIPATIELYFLYYPLYAPATLPMRSTFPRIDSILIAIKAYSAASGVLGSSFLSSVRQMNYSYLTRGTSRFGTGNQLEMNLSLYSLVRGTPIVVRTGFSFSNARLYFNRSNWCYTLGEPHIGSSIEIRFGVLSSSSLLQRTDMLWFLSTLMLMMEDDYRKDNRISHFAPISYTYLDDVSIVEEGNHLLKRGIKYLLVACSETSLLALATVSGIDSVVVLHTSHVLCGDSHPSFYSLFPLESYMGCMIPILEPLLLEYTPVIVVDYSENYDLMSLLNDCLSRLTTVQKLTQVYDLNTIDRDMKIHAGNIHSILEENTVLLLALNTLVASEFLSQFEQVMLHKSTTSRIAFVSVLDGVVQSTSLSPFYSVSLVQYPFETPQSKDIWRLFSSMSGAGSVVNTYESMAMTAFLSFKHLAKNSENRLSDEMDLFSGRSRFINNQLSSYCTQLTRLESGLSYGSVYTNFFSFSSTPNGIVYALGFFKNPEFHRDIGIRAAIYYLNSLATSIEYAGRMLVLTEVHETVEATLFLESFKSALNSDQFCSPSFILTQGSIYSRLIFLISELKQLDRDTVVLVHHNNAEGRKQEAASRSELEYHGIRVITSYLVDMNLASVDTIVSRLVDLLASQGGTIVNYLTSGWCVTFLNALNDRIPDDTHIYMMNQYPTTIVNRLKQGSHRLLFLSHHPTLEDVNYRSVFNTLRSQYQVDESDVDSYTYSVYFSVMLWSDAANATNSRVISDVKRFITMIYHLDAPSVPRVFRNGFMSQRLYEYEAVRDDHALKTVMVYSSGYHYISANPLRLSGSCFLEAKVSIRFGLLVSLSGIDAQRDRSMVIGFLLFYQEYYFRVDRNAEYLMYDLASSSSRCESGYEFLVSNHVDIIFLGYISKCSSRLIPRLQKDRVFMFFSQSLSISVCSRNAISIDDYINQYAGLLCLNMIEESINLDSDLVIVLFDSTIENSEVAASIMVHECRSLPFTVTMFDQSDVDLPEILGDNPGGIIVCATDVSHMIVLMDYLESRQISGHYKVISLLSGSQIIDKTRVQLAGVYFFHSFPTGYPVEYNIYESFMKRVRNYINESASLSYSMLQSIYVIMELVTAIDTAESLFSVARFQDSFQSNFELVVPGGFFRLHGMMFTQSLFLGYFNEMIMYSEFRFTEELSGSNFPGASGDMFMCRMGETVDASEPIQLLYASDLYGNPMLQYILSYTMDYLHLYYSSDRRLELNVFSIDAGRTDYLDSIEGQKFDIMFISASLSVLNLVLDRFGGGDRLVFVTTPFPGGKSYQNVVFASYNSLSLSMKLLGNELAIYNSRSLFLMWGLRYSDFYSEMGAMLLSLSVNLTGSLVSDSIFKILDFIDAEVAPWGWNDMVVFLDFEEPEFFQIIYNSLMMLTRSSTPIIYSIVSCQDPMEFFYPIHSRDSIGFMFFDSSGPLVSSLSVCEVDQVWTLYAISYLVIKGLRSMNLGPLSLDNRFLASRLTGDHTIPPGVSMHIDRNNYVTSDFMAMTRLANGQKFSFTMPTAGVSPILYPLFSLTENEIFIEELDCATGQMTNTTVSFIGLVFDLSIPNSTDTQMLNMILSCLSTIRFGRISSEMYNYPLVLDISRHSLDYESLIARYAPAPLLKIFIGSIPLKSVSKVNAILAENDKFLIELRTIVSWQPQTNVLFMGSSLSLDMDALMTKISLDTRRVIFILDEEDSEEAVLIARYISSYYMSSLIYNYQLSLTMSFERNLHNCYAVGCIIILVVDPVKIARFLHRYSDYSWSTLMVDIYTLSCDLNTLFSESPESLDGIQAIGPFFDMTNSSLSRGPTYDAFVYQFKMLNESSPIFPSPTYCHSYLSITLVSEVVRFIGSFSASNMRQVLYTQNYNSPTGYFAITRSNVLSSILIFARYESRMHNFAIQTIRIQFYSLTNASFLVGQSQIRSVPASLCLWREADAKQFSIYLFLTVSGEFRGTALSILHTILPSIDSVNLEGGIDQQSTILRVVSLFGSDSDGDVFIHVNRDKNQKALIGCFDYTCLDLVLGYIRNSTIPFFGFVEDPTQCFPNGFFYGQMQSQKMELMLTYLRLLPVTKVIFVYDRVSDPLLSELSARFQSNGLEVVHHQPILSESDVHSLKAILDSIDRSSQYALVLMLSLSSGYDSVMREVIVPFLNRSIVMASTFDPYFISEKSMPDLERLVFTTTTVQYSSSYSDTIMNLANSLSDGFSNTELIALSGSILSVMKKTIENAKNQQVTDMELTHQEGRVLNEFAIVSYMRLAFSEVMIHSGDIVFTGSKKNTIDHSMHLGQIKSGRVVKVGVSLGGADPTETTEQSSDPCVFSISKTYFLYNDSISRTIRFLFLGLFLLIVAVFIILTVVFRKSIAIKRTSPYIMVCCYLACALHAVLDDSLFRPRPRSPVTCSIVSLLRHGCLFSVISLYVLKMWRIHSLVSYSKLSRHRITDRRLFAYALVLVLANLAAIGIIWSMQYPSEYREILYSSKSTSVEKQYFILCMDSLPLQLFEIIAFLLMITGGVAFSWMNRSVDSEFNEALSSVLLLGIYSVYVCIQYVIYLDVTPNVTYVLSSFLVPSVHTVALSFVALPRFYALFFHMNEHQNPDTEIPVFQVSYCYSAEHRDVMSPNGMNATYSPSGVGAIGQSSSLRYDSMAFTSRGVIPRAGALRRGSMIEATAKGTIIQTRLGKVTRIIPGNRKASLHPPRAD